MGKMNDAWQNLVNFLMPGEAEDDYEMEEVQPQQKMQQQQAAGTMLRTGTGGYADVPPMSSVAYGTTSAHIGNAQSSEVVQFPTKATGRPTLTVHENKVPSMKVRLYSPEKFDHAKEIADDFKNGQAVLINFEKIDAQGHRRICDFMNGVCYVLDGSARLVTNDIMFYAPSGVDVTDGIPSGLVK